MKRSNLKKTYTPKKAFHTKLLTSLKRVFNIIAELKSGSKSHVSKKGVSDTFLAHDELRRINNQLLKAERQRAEATWMIHEKRRCR